MKFLRFNSKAEAASVLNTWMIEGAWPTYIGRVAVDVVGIIYRPTGEAQQSEGGGAPVFEPLPGWHINLSERVAELQQYEIAPPVTPERVFAGSETQPQGS